MKIINITMEIFKLTTTERSMAVRSNVQVLLIAFFSITVVLCFINFYHNMLRSTENTIWAFQLREAIRRICETITCRNCTTIPHQLMRHFWLGSFSQKITFTVTIFTWSFPCDYLLFSRMKKFNDIFDHASYEGKKRKRGK